MTSDANPYQGAETLPFLPFSRPSISEADIAAVSDVLRSGWLTTGQRCLDFEQAFAQYTGARHAVAVTSATAGMHLLLHALDLGPGDEVITPSMTWVSTVNLIQLCGATPVFVDVDRDTLMVSAEHVERALTRRTKAIVPVHFAGTALHLDPLRTLAERRGVPMLEDAAHAAGTAYKGRPIGSAGTAIFSLHPIKNLTSGEGGVVCTDDTNLAERLRRLRFHGLGADAFDRETHGRSPQAEVLEPGFKYNLPDINAALALSQLKRLDAMNAKRALLAERYTQLLRDVEIVIPLTVPAYEHTHAWHLYVVRLDTELTGWTRQEFMARLKHLGIGTGVHFRAVHEQRYYRTCGIDFGPLPETTWNSDRVCSLPLFPDMTLSDVDRVVDGLRQLERETKR